MVVTIGSFNVNIKTVTVPDGYTCLPVVSKTTSKCWGHNPALSDSMLGYEWNLTLLVAQ